MTVPPFDSLRTERLVVRIVRPDDVDPLWERRNDPSTAEFQNWSLPYPRDMAREVIEMSVSCGSAPPANGWMQLAIDDGASGSPVGDLALGLTFDGRCAEIGWTVDAAHRGRGIAQEAATALTRWLFDTVGVARVQATMHPENLASVRVAEQLGMVVEGHTRNSFWVGDVNSDDWILAMTVDDWRAWIARPDHRPEEVALVEITEANLRRVFRLATHRSQERFVAPVAASLAAALVPGTHDGEDVVPWYRAIEADGEIVGFVMTAEPTAGEPVPYLWRFLIDRMHQRRGIGSMALDLVIDRARAMGATALDLSWSEGRGSPEAFYLARGFVPTGEIEDDEIVARLDLTR
ncbi:MAG: GNAT family N-acetyltransferase [Ilumatobacter sp.]